MDDGDTQDWSIGSTVKVGGRSYVVLDHLPAEGKGLAPRRLIQREGSDRRYEFTPHRGLKLLNGELIRRRKRYPKGQGPKSQAAKLVKVSRTGLPADAPRMVAKAPRTRRAPPAAPTPPPAAAAPPKVGIFMRAAALFGIGVKRPPIEQKPASQEAPRRPFRGHPKA